MTPDERIAAMQTIYGITPGQKCASCNNLFSRRTKRVYHKCRLYGVSFSEATDWRVSNTACGMWGKDGSRLIPLLEQLKRLSRPVIEQPIKGQLDMFGKEAGKDENA